MSNRTFLATTLLSLLSAGAIAAEGTQDLPPASNSGATRAEVKADLADAQRNSRSFGFTEASPAPQARSTLTRAQVRAEAREAMRLGLLEHHEGDSAAPTAAQLEQVRLAGLRAVQNPVVAAQAR